MLEFISDYSIGYYPNSLCISDKSKFSFWSNTNYNMFKNIILSIDACNPKERTCAEKADIEKFIRNNQFYYTKQNNFINKDIYSYTKGFDLNFDEDNIMVRIVLADDNFIDDSLKYSLSDLKKVFYKKKQKWCRLDW